MAYGDPPCDGLGARSAARKIDLPDGHKKEALNLGGFPFGLRRPLRTGQVEIDAPPSLMQAVASRWAEKCSLAHFAHGWRGP